MQRLFRCYAEGRGGEWEAICLDIDIAVQGESLDEVVRELNSAICFHLETVLELPEAERQRFLHRSAPLALRLRFLWHAFRGLIREDRSPEPKQRAEFTAACTA